MLSVSTEVYFYFNFQVLWGPYVMLRIESGLAFWKAHSAVHPILCLWAITEVLRFNH